MVLGILEDIQILHTLIKFSATGSVKPEKPKGEKTVFIDYWLNQASCLQDLV